MADGHASYVDLLGEHAFGNYRQLLEAVAEFDEADKLLDGRLRTHDHAPGESNV